MTNFANLADLVGGGRSEVWLLPFIGCWPDLQTRQGYAVQCNLSEPQTGREGGREEGGHRRVSQYCHQIMDSQDIPVEDIVLLQLFKDHLVSPSVEESPGLCDHHCPAALSEVSTTSTASDLSDLDSVLSQQCQQVK